MKTIRHTSTLFYYDGPQVFEARDVIGGHYIALMVEPEGDNDCYLVTGVAPEQLRRFRGGLVDLRALLIEGGAEEWYLATVESGLDQPLNLCVQNTLLSESSMLPDSGFILHDHPVESRVLMTSRERNNFVLEISVEPPETTAGHRIHANTLAGLLANTQSIVKHALAFALRSLPKSDRLAIDKNNACLLDVVIPAAPGSFRVVLEAAETPDMLGHSELHRALGRIDELFNDVSNPRIVTQSLREHKGHLAGAYLKLLRFLQEHKTGFSYSWAEPSFQKPISRSVNQGEVTPLIDALSGVSDLAAEPVSIEGTLKKADSDNGTWRIATDDGNRSGKVKKKGPSLKGLRIGNKYRCSCIEEISEVEGTGREQRDLYLIEYEAL